MTYIHNVETSVLTALRRQPSTQNQFATTPRDSAEPSSRLWPIGIPSCGSRKAGFGEQLVRDCMRVCVYVCVFGTVVLWLAGVVKEAPWTLASQPPGQEIQTGTNAIMLTANKPLGFCGAGGERKSLRTRLKASGT